MLVRASSVTSILLEGPVGQGVTDFFHEFDFSTYSFNVSYPASSDSVIPFSIGEAFP